MGTVNAYDHPNSTVRREVHVNNLLGLASTSMQTVFFYQACTLKAIHSQVVTAGTNDVAGVTINNGTDSVGTIVHGTATASTVQTSGALNATVAANSYVELVGVATSATMVNSYVLEVEVLPGATVTD